MQEYRRWFSNHGSLPEIPVFSASRAPSSKEPMMNGKALVVVAAATAVAAADPAESRRGSQAPDPCVQANRLSLCRVRRSWTRSSILSSMRLGQSAISSICVRGANVLRERSRRFAAGGRGNRPRLDTARISSSSSRMTCCGETAS